MPTEITFVPAYAGQFLREYKPSPNVHSLTNDLYTKTARVSPTFLGAIIPNEVQFPDVSFWQGAINWDIFATHTKAVIIRIGQAKFVDTQFERNYAEAIKRGLRVGFYFFYDDRYSPGDQATTLLNALRGKQIDMEVFIDWENSYGGSFKGLPQVVAMMQAVEAGLPGERIGMYTGYYWFRENSNSITHANQYAYLKYKPLWLAWYASDPSSVLIPAPWTFITHWQFGTPAVTWGQETRELDMNRCGCTAQEFVVRYGGEIDTGGGTETMMRYKVVWSPGVARRTGPQATASTWTGMSYANQLEVDVVEDNIPDAIEPTNLNKRWVRFADGLFGAAVYPDSAGVTRVRMEKIIEPDPTPDRVLFHFKLEGYKEITGELEKE